MVHIRALDAGALGRLVLLCLAMSVLVVSGCGDDETPGRGESSADALSEPERANACGGARDLDARPGEACGPCASGRWQCDDGGELVCEGARSPNACGGCGDLLAEAGSPCGPCGGVWVCTEAGTLQCEGARPRNECGGCEVLDAQVNYSCFNGIYTCDGPNAVVCRTTGANACGGDADARLEPPPGRACGSCEQGVVVCDGGERTVCADAELGTNLCGGCGVLDGAPGAPCGCDGVWRCGSDGHVVCDGDRPPNACGGCEALDAPLGAACDGGVQVCTPDGRVQCRAAGQNACGGTLPLDGAPGAGCGPCGDGILRCASTYALACFGATEVNDCGSCGLLAGVPGDACGTGRVWRCRGGVLECTQAPQRNACGGAAVLATPPGSACGDCADGVTICVSENATQCFGDRGRNVCGGCATLNADGVPFRDVLGAPCGVCNSGAWACGGQDEVLCVGNDERALRTYYADRDGDGFGASDETRAACSVPLGFVENADDCDDQNPGDRPGAEERCDGRDNDCDGAIDEPFVAYLDRDLDGFGDPDAAIVACALSEGLSREGTDCDDADERAFPGQSVGFFETRADGTWDYDCDGRSTPLLTERPACVAPPLCGTDGLSEPLQGWASALIPRCGERGAWLLRCELTIAGCTSTIDDDLRPQLCR